MLTGGSNGGFRLTHCKTLLENVKVAKHRTISPHRRNSADMRSESPVLVSLAKPRLLGRGEGLVKCPYATCSTVMLGYVTTNRKSVTFRNTRSNAGVFSLLNKLSLHRMASASHIHKPASVLGIITRARSSNQSLHAWRRCIRSPIATGH